MATNRQSRHSLKQQTMRYFKQLTQGCGWQNCQNVDCASSPDAKSYTSNEALKKSLELLKSNVPLCRNLRNEYIPNAHKPSKHEDRSSTSDNILETPVSAEEAIQYDTYLEQGQTHSIPTIFRKFSLPTSTRVRIWRIFASGDSEELDLTGSMESVRSQDILMISASTSVDRDGSSSASDGESDVNADEKNYEPESLRLLSPRLQWLDIFQRKAGQKKRSPHRKTCIAQALNGPYQIVNNSESNCSKDRVSISNAEGHELLISRALIDPPVASSSSFEALTSLVDQTFVIMLCHGGRFAGAVFRGGKCLTHKTFSRYVVRKKQGGRQIEQTGVAHSAGSWMRRYHETRLKEEISALLREWRAHFTDARAIFVHCPGKHNRRLIFDTGVVSDDARIFGV
eukprot:279659_1